MLAAFDCVVRPRRNHGVRPSHLPRLDGPWSVSPTTSFPPLSSTLTQSPSRAVHKVKKREHDIIAADHAQELQDEHDDHKWKMTKLDPQGQGMAKMNENYRTGYENKEYGFSSLGKKQREERRESGEVSGLQASGDGRREEGVARSQEELFFIDGVALLPGNSRVGDSLG